MKEQSLRLLTLLLKGLTVPALMVWVVWALPERHSVHSLDELAWLAGYWRGSQGGTVSEELWTLASGGIMLGVHRDVSPAGKAFFEYLRIVETEEGLVYYASPMGREATPFQLKSLAPSRVVFANPKHDFPQEISYWLDNEGMLHSEISGIRGSARSRSEWVWEPVPFPIAD